MPTNLENSAIATGLERVIFSFQSQRKAMSKSVQTTAQLHSFHMLGTRGFPCSSVGKESACSAGDQSLIPGSPGFSKSSLNIWKFTNHVLLKPGLENFEHYFTSVWDECNCAVVWAFFGIAFLWDWNKNWHFPVLWPLLSFPNLLAYWVQYLNSIIF